MEAKMVYVGDRVFAKSEGLGWLPGVARDYDVEDKKFFVEFFDGRLDLVSERSVVTEKQYEDVHGYW